MEFKLLFFQIRGKLFKAPAGPENPMVRSEPGDVYMTKKFALLAEAVYNMEVRPDDVWIVTYPKCGTTWTQELVWQVGDSPNSFSYLVSQRISLENKIHQFI